MNVNSKNSRLLGIAFILQFITSITSGLLARDALIEPGNISESMVNIANDVWLMKVYIGLDMLTALGIIFLGAMLYLTLKQQNQTMALVGFGFYILEAGLLASSRIDTFALLRLSQEYVSAGNPADLQTLGAIALESMDFVGSTLHVLVFGPGAILFYTLLYRSEVVPRGLSLWGLITVMVVFAAMLTDFFGYQLPMIIILPYIPFEFVIGVWFVVKGIKH